ncbi:hypothetical protein [Aestuariivivens sediminicola]|uniref:hypothetical protein n=1 Tax=Aestuariivivens sediminicola TaxID=2913560 RepID=UPI001F5AD41B|nr:hypothetical protein [Aestuariivivens sediminicola]
MKKILDTIRLKWAEYLLELIVIVIGILGAFILNNWNDQRKEQGQQKKLLNKLRIELNADVNRFLEMDSIYTSWIEQSEKIINLLHSGSTNSISSIEDYLVGQASLYDITVNRITFDEMLNTGAVYKLHSENLSHKISEYYEYANVHAGKRNRDNQELYGYILASMKGDGINRIIRLSYQVNLEHMDWDWLLDPSSDHYKELESRTYWVNHALIGNKEVILQLRIKAEELIQKISTSVKK